MTATLLSAKDLMGEGAPALRAAQDRGWYAETELGKAVLGYAEVQRLLRDRRFRNMGTDLMTLQGIDDGLVRRTYEGFLLSMEGDEHARRRGLVRKAFDRASIESMRPGMRETLNALLDRACLAPRFDFVSDVAAPYPTQVIVRALGFDVSSHDVEFMNACSDLGYIVGFEVREHLALLESAIRTIQARVERVLADRRASPGSDVISRLICAEGVSTEQLFAMVVTLLFGGFDTTRRTLAKAFVILLERPDQWQLLRERPELAERATEEIFRFAPGTKVAVRVALEDVDFEGLIIREGELLYAATGAANRDPRVYAEPDRFDITREGPPPLTFGGGPHTCLGAGLARAELCEALPILVERLAHVRLDGLITWRTAIEGSPGPMSIPLSVS